MKKSSLALLATAALFLTLVAGCAQGIVRDESMRKGTGEANSSDQKEEREKALQTNSSDSGSSDMTKKMLADARKISRATVMADKEGVVIVFKAISILSARGKIHNGGRVVLNEVANYLKEYPTAAVKIRCHSDNTGRAETQKALTDKRAQIIKSYLVDFQNISPDRIIAKGFGGDRPVADNNTASGRALNRRIEMVLAIGK